MDVIQRSKGHSATHEAAYITGQKITDECTGLIHDFTHKKGVLGHSVVGPTHMDAEWFANVLESAERRGNSVTARTIHVALPEEFTDEGRWTLLHRLGAYLWSKFNLGSLIAQHQPPHDPWSSGRNHHGHLLFPTRTMDMAGTLGKKTRSWDIKATSHLIMRELRMAWATMVNEALAAAGFTARVDHRALKDRGDARVPKRHLSRGEYIAAFMGRAESQYAKDNREAQRTVEKENEIKQLEKEIDAEQDTIRHRAFAAIIGSKRRSSETDRRIKRGACTRRVARHRIECFHRSERGGLAAIRSRLDQTFQRAHDFVRFEWWHPHRRHSDPGGHQLADTGSRRRDAKTRGQDQRLERPTSSKDETKKKARLTGARQFAPAKPLVFHPLGTTGRSYLAETRSLDNATIEAFANNLQECVNGSICAAHNVWGDGEQRGRESERFTGDLAQGEDRGRSVWWGRPHGSRKFSYVLVAKSFVNVLSAWETIPDAERRACTLVASTGGSNITADGIEKLQKLIALVRRSQPENEAQTIYLVDATDRVDAIQAEHRSTILRKLAEDTKLQYHRYAPKEDGLDWNDSLLAMKYRRSLLEIQQTPTASGDEQGSVSHEEEASVARDGSASTLTDAALGGTSVKDQIEDTTQKENSGVHDAGEDQAPRRSRSR